MLPVVFRVGHLLNVIDLGVEKRLDGDLGRVFNELVVVAAMLLI